MTLNNWTPQEGISAPEFTIDKNLLLRFIQIIESNTLDSLETQLSPKEIQSNAPLMRLSHQQWIDNCETLSLVQIKALIRFFTLAEQLPGWQAGNQSPVIGLVKLLKKQKISLDKDLARWIKAHSDNRFLPHGSLL